MECIGIFVAALMRSLYRVSYSLSSAEECPMKRINSQTSLFLLGAAALLAQAGCNSVQVDAAAQGPPPARVVSIADAALFSVEHPEQFPVATAVARPTTSELVVTGAVMPDVSRNVPVVSLASGRVMAVHTRLGDTVQKGELLMTIRSDDVSGGYSTYKMAVADEVLSRTQYERSKDLYEHGAIALNDLQVAQDIEDKAKVAVDTAAEHLRLLGNDPDKVNFTVDGLAGTGIQFSIPVHYLGSRGDLGRLRCL
jgi:cobalt-zinc-cadmium efflux system membrane fusion protein